MNDKPTTNDTLADDMEPRRNVGGRPEADVDAADVEALATLGARVTDVARKLGCSTDTIYRRYMDAYERGLTAGRLENLQMMWACARKGEFKAMKWLSQQKIINGFSSAQTTEDVTPQTSTPWGELAKHATPEQLETLHALLSKIQPPADAAGSAEPLDR